MDSRLISRPKALPNTLLLKDYLLDDFSSCSSNGFKSFPRRQCCATVRFLLQNELKKKHENKFLNFTKNPPKPTNPQSKSALSAFQNVISAVKRLPFSGVSSPEKKKCKSSFLPRSFSRKILKKCFWKRKSNSKEIPRWTSFNQLMKDDPEPLDHSINSVSSESKSNSSSGSNFTVSTDECSSGNSPSGVKPNLPVEKNDVVDVAIGSKVVAVPNDDVSVGSTTSSDGGASTNSSTDTKKKQWPNEEKEQCSPVSVLDCPFEDEVSSPFQHRLARMEGTKNKLMKKIQRLESLAQLEPVNLSKRLTSLPDSDNESIGSPFPRSSASIDEKFISDIEEDEQEEEEEEGNQVEERAMELLDQLKETLPSYYGLKLKEDKLLLDLFREKIVDSKKRSGGGYLFDEQVLEEAERWINGRKGNGLLVDWEVQTNRQAYIKDMEREGEWKTLNQENEEVALELESEVFASLLNDLLLLDI